MARGSQVDANGESGAVKIPLVNGNVNTKNTGDGIGK